MLRLGDVYNAYPKHVNVLNELWGRIKHDLGGFLATRKAPSSTDLAADDVAGAGGPGAGGAGSSGSLLGNRPGLPEQTTTVSLVTETRSMDVSVALLVEEDDLVPMDGYEDEWGTDFHEEQLSSDENDESDDGSEYGDFISDSIGGRQVSGGAEANGTTAALESQGSTGDFAIMGGLLDWMSLGSSSSSSSATAKGSSASGTSSSDKESSKSAANKVRVSKKGSAAASTGNVSTAGVDASPSRRAHMSTTQWLVEKTRLEGRIRELELRNVWLEDKLAQIPTGATPTKSPKKDP
jgi:hypothetical protein